MDAMSDTSGAAVHSGSRPTERRREGSRHRGVGTVLVAVYAILAIAATGRSLVQALREFSEAPLPITLSTVAAVVYLLATLALIAPGRAWYRVAVVTISFELVGVLLVGALSLLAPELFASGASVWSWFGLGYGFVPLLLPFFGLWWLRVNRPTAVAAAS